MARDPVEHEKQTRKEDPVKIVDLRVTPIAFADPPLRSSYGLHAPYALRTVVELVGEDGLVGVSEAHGGEQTLVDFARAREAVVGRDVYDLARMWLAIAGAFGRRAEAPDAPGVDRSHTYLLPGEGRLDVPLRVYAAIEVAALDLIGKMVGKPVCDLLGGRVRDEVPFSAYLFYKHRGGGGVGDDARRDVWGEALTPEALVSQATAMIEEYGFGSVKLKGGVFDPDLEIETMRALREALGPGVPLRIDPNAAWSVETSLRVGAELAGALEYLEDPTPGLARYGRCPARIARRRERFAAGEQYRRHQFCRRARGRAHGCRTGDPGGSPLLGRAARDHPTRPVVRDVRSRAEHALQQSPRRLAPGDDPRRRRDAGSYLCL